jgi:hypothetical protein
MLITFCKSKIAHASITQAELYYEGSITVDEDLLRAVDITPGEKVEILNLSNCRQGRFRPDLSQRPGGPQWCSGRQGHYFELCASGFQRGEKL